MFGVPCIKLDWETFKERILVRNYQVFENETAAWVISNYFLIIADKPKGECGSTNLVKDSIPSIGFGTYRTR